MPKGCIDVPYHGNSWPERRTTRRYIRTGRRPHSTEFKIFATVGIICVLITLLGVVLDEFRKQEKPQGQSAEETVRHQEIRLDVLKSTEDTETKPAVQKRTYPDTKILFVFKDYAESYTHRTTEWMMLQALKDGT